MKKCLFLICFLSFNLFAQITRTTEGFVPTGAVISFALNSCPAGFLIADGTNVSRVTYKKLFDLMGTIHGTANGTTTFALPDYRGNFLRMVDGTKGIDTDKASRTAMATGGAVGNNVGSIQTSINATHGHNIFNNDGGSSTPAVNLTSSNYVDADPNGNVNYMSYAMTSISASIPYLGLTSPSGGSESRPRNSYIIYCVKY